MSTSLAAPIAAHDLAFVCGPGGVGKTTTAAALALRVALTTDRRVLVVTVDPARRLADALGLTISGNQPVGVRLPRRSKGRLDAAMLDTKAAWDALVTRHAPDRSVRDRLLANPLYETVTARFGLSHEYIAMERVFELRSSGSYDLIIVDTAPMSNAVDFLDAPERMSEFFASKLVRWLTVPAGSRLAAAASRPFTNLAERLLGATFFADIIDFFTLLRTMESGFAARASEVSSILRSDGTTFVPVTTLDPGPLAQLAAVRAALHRRSLSVGGLVVNRVLPVEFAQDELRSVAESLTDNADRILRRAAVGALEVQQRAVAQQQQLAELMLAAAQTPIAVVALQADGINDVARLERIGAVLF
jgi:anion-transporting  ArsA/GET3 family ATPase